MDSVDVVVIGAGAVGLACARKFSDAGLATIVLESEAGFGAGASSRNSEVIHAGLYYPPGSLKAELCLRGRELLYDYCQARGINHSQVGKWVVANGPTQLAALEKIAKTARANGCDEVYWIDGLEAQEQEPELIAERVLVSPRTGIIDSHAYMLCLLADLESKGGMFVPRTKVISGRAADGGIVLKTQGDGEFELRAKFVVNSAGINAPFLVEKFGSKYTPILPEKGFAKGNYFSLSGKSPFKRLVYPVPEPGGLGVHLTLSLDGRARFGPDVEWVSNVNYDVDPNRKKFLVKPLENIGEILIRKGCT